MTIPGSTLSLDLDLGPVNRGGQAHPFAVTLEAAPLARLLEDAREAHRVHELLLIGRPGDLWDYVLARPAHLPPPVAERLAQAMAAEGQAQAAPAGTVPFRAFDGLFRWAWDDTEPEDEAWILARDGELVRAWARELLAALEVARAGLAEAGSLVRHEMACFAADTHPYAFLARDEAIAAGRAMAPGEPAHTPAFYAKLAQLLRERDVVSVSYRGRGDYRVLREICEAQRERAGQLGVPPAQALEISALVEREANTRPWDAEVTYFSGEQEQGYLHVEEPGAGGESVKDLVERYTRIGPGGCILSSRDEGTIRGYEVESGEGWTLYRSDVSPRMSPAMRRYHNVWSLMRGQENGEVNDEQVVEVMALWAEYRSWRVQEPPG